MKEILKSDEKEIRLIDMLPKLPSCVSDGKELGKKFRFEDVTYKKLVVNSDGKTKREKALFVCVVFIYPDSGLSHWSADALFQGLSGNSLRHFTFFPSSFLSSSPSSTVSRIEDINRCVSKGKDAQKILDMFSRYKTDLRGNLCDYRGATPLHYAAKNGDKTLCEMLMINFENDFEMLQTKDECGRDALNYLLIFINLKAKVGQCLQSEDDQETKSNASYDLKSEASVSLKKTHKKKSKSTKHGKGETPPSIVAKIEEKSWRDEAELSPHVKGQLDVVMYLLTQKPDLHSIDHMGLTSFYHLQNLRDIYLKYIIRRIDPCHVSDSVVLHFANAGLQLMQTDELDCDQVLTKFFEELLPGRNNYVFPPLHLATVHGKIKFVESLLVRGHDPEKKDVTGNLPFHIACQRGNGPLIKLLYFEGMENGDYIRGVKTVFETCIRKRKSMSAFEETCQLRKEKLQLDDQFKKCIIMELEKNITVSQWVHVLRILPKNIQHRFLSQASYLGCYEAVEVLLESELDVNVKDFMGRTALHEAMLFGRYDIMKLLLDKNADPNVVDDRGASPLHYACQCIDPHLLISSSNRKFYGSTCSMKRQDIVLNCMDYMITNSEVDLAIQDVCGRTPLLVAVHQKRYHVFKWLLKNYLKECKPFWTDIQGFDILYYLPEMDENTLNFTLEKVAKIFEDRSNIDQNIEISWLSKVQSIEVTQRYWNIEEEEQKREKEYEKKTKIPDRIRNCINRNVLSTGYKAIIYTSADDLLLDLMSTNKSSSAPILRTVLEALPSIVADKYSVFQATIAAARNWDIDCLSFLLKFRTPTKIELSALLVVVVSETPLCYHFSKRLAKDKKGVTTTKYLKTCQINIIKMLLESGASPNFLVWSYLEYYEFSSWKFRRLSSKYTSMELAVINQDRAVVKELLPFTIIHGCFAAHIAALQGDVELTQLLLESAILETKEGKDASILCDEIQEAIDRDVLAFGILKAACCSRKPTLELFKCILQYFPKVLKSTKWVNERFFQDMLNAHILKEFGFDYESVSPITALLKNKNKIKEKHLLVSFLLEKGIYMDEIRVKRNREKTIHATCEALSTAIWKRQWECVNVLLEQSGRIFFQCQTREKHSCHFNNWFESSCFPLISDRMNTVVNNYPIETLRVHLVEAEKFFEQVRPDSKLKWEIMKKLSFEEPAEGAGTFVLYLAWLMHQLRSYKMYLRMKLIYLVFQLNMGKQEMLTFLSICHNFSYTYYREYFSNWKDVIYLEDYSKAEKKKMLKIFRKTPRRNILPGTIGTGDGHQEYQKHLTWKEKYDFFDVKPVSDWPDHTTPQMTMLHKGNGVNMSAENQTSFQNKMLPSTETDSPNPAIYKQSACASNGVDVEDNYSETYHHYTTPSISNPEILQRPTDESSKNNNLATNINRTKEILKNSYKRNWSSIFQSSTCNGVHKPLIKGRRHFGLHNKSVIKDYLMLNSQSNDESVKVKIGQRQARFLPKKTDPLKITTTIHEKKCSLLTLQRCRNVSTDIAHKITKSEKCDSSSMSPQNKILDKQPVCTSNGLEAGNIYLEVDHDYVTPSISNPETPEQPIHEKTRNDNLATNIYRTKAWVTNSNIRHRSSVFQPSACNGVHKPLTKGRRYYGLKNKSVIKDYLMLKSQSNAESVKIRIGQRQDRFLRKSQDSLVIKTAFNEKQCSLLTLQKRRIVSPREINITSSHLKRYKRSKLTYFGRYLLGSCIVGRQLRYWPPQHTAAASGDLVLMKSILEKTSVKVLNLPVNDILPLSAASARLDRKMVDLLLQHGAQPHGSCILASCMGHSYLDKVNGLKWTSRNKDSLISKDRMDMVRFLVEKGCRVDYTEQERGNGLLWAMIDEDWNLVDFLLDAGKTSVVMKPPLVQMMKKVSDKLCCKVVKSLKRQTLTSGDEECLYKVCIAVSKRPTSVVLKTLFLEVLEPIMTDIRQPLHNTLKPNKNGQLLVELLSVQGLVDELQATLALLAKDTDVALIFKANPIIHALKNEQWATVELLLLNGFLPKGHFDKPSRSSLKPGHNRERLTKFLNLATFAISKNYTLLQAASTFDERGIIEEMLKQPLSSVVLASLTSHPSIEAALNHHNGSYNMCLDKIRWKPERDIKTSNTILRFLSSFIDIGGTMRYLMRQLRAHGINIRENDLFGHISKLLTSLSTCPPETSFSVENTADFLNRYLTTKNIDENVLILIAVAGGKVLNANILETIRSKISTKDMLRDLVGGFTFLDLSVIFSGHDDHSLLADFEHVHRNYQQIIASLISKDDCKIQSLTLKIANRKNQLAILSIIFEAMIRGKADSISANIEEWIPVLYNAAKQSNKRFVEAFFKVKSPTEDLVYKCLAICILKGNDELVAYLITLRDIDLLKPFTLPFGPESLKTSILECLGRSRFFGKIKTLLSQLTTNETLTTPHYLCMCRTGSLELWTNIHQSSETFRYFFECLDVAVSAGHERLSMKIFEFKEFFSQSKIQEEVTKRGILHSACRYNMRTLLDEILRTIEKTPAIQEALMTPDTHGITPLDYAKLMGHINLYLKLTSDYSLSLTVAIHEDYLTAFGMLRFLMEENESKEVIIRDHCDILLDKVQDEDEGRSTLSELRGYVAANDRFAALTYIRIQRELIANQVKSNNTKYPYFHLLVRGDFDECFKLLLGYLGDDVPDLPLWLAFKTGAKMCLKILMEREGILDYESPNDDNILHLVAELDDEEIIELVNARCGIDMRKAKNKQGFTPAMVSAALGNHKVVPLLLKNVELEDISNGHHSHNILEQECIKCTMNSCVGWSKMYQQILTNSDSKITDFQPTRLLDKNEITDSNLYESPTHVTLSKWVNNRRPWQLESGSGGQKELGEDILMKVLLATMGFNGGRDELTLILSGDIISRIITLPNMQAMATHVFKELGTMDDDRLVILLKLAVQYNRLFMIKIIEEHKKEVLLDSRNRALSEAFGAGHFELASHIMALITDSEKNLDDHLQPLKELEEALPLRVALSCGLKLPGEKGWDEKHSTLSDSDCLEIMCLESFLLIDKIKDSALIDSMIPEYVRGKKLIIDLNKFEKRCPGIAPVELKRRITTEILQRYPTFICLESDAWKKVVSINVGCLNVSDATKPEVSLQGNVLFDTVQVKLEDQGKSFHIECSNTGPKELSFEHFMESNITDTVIPELTAFIKTELDMEVKIKVDWSSIYSQNVPSITILTTMMESVWSQLGGLQSILKSCSNLLNLMKEEFSSELVNSVQTLLKPITEIEVLYVQSLSQYTKYNYGKLGSIILWEFTLQEGNHLTYNANNFPIYDILRTCYIGNNAMFAESYHLHGPNDILGKSPGRSKYQLLINWTSFSQMGINARKFFIQNLGPEIQNLVIAKRSHPVVSVAVDKLEIRNSATRNASFSYSLLDKIISIEVHCVQNGNQWNLISNDYERELAKIERDLVLSDENFSRWCEHTESEIQSTLWQKSVRDKTKMLTKKKTRRSNEDEIERSNMDEGQRSTTDEHQITSADEHQRSTIDEHQRSTIDEHQRSTIDEHQRSTIDESQALPPKFKNDFSLDLTVPNITDLVIDSRLAVPQLVSSMKNMTYWLESACIEFRKDLFDYVDFVLRNNFRCSYVGYYTIPSGIWEPFDGDEQDEARILMMTNYSPPTFRLKREKEELGNVFMSWRFIRFSRGVKGLLDRKSYLISFNNRLYHALDKTTLESCVSVLPRKIHCDVKSSHFNVKFIIQGFDREKLIPGDIFVKKCRDMTLSLLKRDSCLSELWYCGIKCGLDITYDITGLTELWKESVDTELQTVCHKLMDQLQLLESLKISGYILTNMHIGVLPRDDPAKNGISKDGLSIFIHPPAGLDILFSKQEVHDLTPTFLISLSRLVGDYLKTKVEATLQQLSSSVQIQVVKLKSSSEFEQYINNCFTLLFSFCSSLAFIIDNFENPLEIICLKATKICLDPNVPGKYPGCIHYNKDTLYIRVPLYTIFPSIKFIKAFTKATKNISCVGPPVFYEPLIIGNKICMQKVDSLNELYVKCVSFAPFEMTWQDLKNFLQTELIITTRTQKIVKQKVTVEDIQLLDQDKRIFKVRITPSSETESYQVDLRYFEPHHFLSTQLFKDVSCISESGLFACGQFCLSVEKTCHCDSSTECDKDPAKERGVSKKHKGSGRDRIHHQYYEGSMIVDFCDTPSYKFLVSTLNTKDSSLVLVSNKSFYRRSASLRAVCRNCYEPFKIRSSFGTITNEPVKLNFLPSSPVESEAFKNKQRSKTLRNNRGFLLF